MVTGAVGSGLSALGYGLSAALLVQRARWTSRVGLWRRSSMLAVIPRSSGAAVVEAKALGGT